MVMKNFVLCAAVLVVASVSPCFAQELSKQNMISYLKEVKVVSWNHENRLFFVEVKDTEPGDNGNIRFTGTIRARESFKGEVGKELFRDLPMYGVTDGKQTRIVCITRDQSLVFTGELVNVMGHIMLSAAEDKDAGATLRMAFDKAIGK
jgi:hypothetical protein